MAAASDNGYVMPKPALLRRVLSSMPVSVVIYLLVIGVIINSLKSGLSSVAKGVGNGLKTIGKKLGELLPGMVGAIASFIFKNCWGGRRLSC